MLTLNLALLSRVIACIGEGGGEGLGEGVRP